MMDPVIAASHIAMSDFSRAREARVFRYLLLANQADRVIQVESKFTKACDITSVFLSSRHLFC